MVINSKIKERLSSVETSIRLYEEQRESILCDLFRSLHSHRPVILLLQNSRIGKKSEFSLSRV